jgi:hypothetical protein
VQEDTANCRGGKKAVERRSSVWLDWPNYWGAGDASSKTTGLSAITALGKHLKPNERGVDGALKKGMDDLGVKYKKRFNDDVKLYAPYVYDAVTVMVDAMQRAKSSDPAKYLPELAKTSGYKGVTGTISFDSKGDIKNGALTLYTYKAGKRDQLAVVR